MQKYGRIVLNLCGWNRIKRWIGIILVTFLCLLSGVTVYAHDRDEHDADIEYVLFGDRNYKSTHPVVKSKIQAIEDAAYLCIDQFNGAGKESLKNLQNEGVPNIPKSIDEIDFKSNNVHRYYTHREWNITSNSEGAHWPVRQAILKNTVDKELFSNSKSLVSKIPVLSNLFAKDEIKDNRQKCEAFCVLIYYIHIIGDHNEAEKFSSLANVDPLTSLNDRDNPGIIPDLMKYCGILFKDQKDTYTYEAFIQGLEDLRNKSDKITSSKGGVNTNKKFGIYHQYSYDLLETLATYIPKMVKNEELFQTSFPMA